MSINQSALFLRYLKQLSKLIDKIEMHENGNAEILNTRLSDCMFPLLTHARIAANFSLRACCATAEVERVTFDNNEISFSGLRKQLSETIAYIQTLTSAKTDQSDNKVHDKAGIIDIYLPKLEYVDSFALPNFFFHLSMVYATARNQGVPVSKGDYDGYHSYPDGFSFDK